MKIPPRITIPVIGFLLAGNMYFINKLVERIDATFEMGVDNRKGLAVLSAIVETLKETINGRRK